MLRCSDNFDITDDAREQCNGLDSCNYHGNNAVAGDPCGGISKYTELVWRCLDKNKEAMCAYMSTSDVTMNWKTTSCYEPEAFACTIAAGQSKGYFETFKIILRTF
jgi:hypothetical protein